MNAPRITRPMTPLGRQRLAQPATLPVSIVLCMATALWVSGTARADVWVFEPSAALDQRIDDNYRIDSEDPQGVNATRVVGSLGLSRESPIYSVKGVLRIDGLLTDNENAPSELSSNQILYFDTALRRERSRYGLGLNIKRDTPSRDISADITDVTATAADTGASVTQDDNSPRLRTVITPNWSYDLSRRTSLRLGYSYTDVAHELPSVEDAYAAQWLLTNPRPVPDDVRDQIGVFSPANELDDFTESEFTAGYRYKWTPLVTWSVNVSYKDYASMTEPHPNVITPFDDLIPDPNEPQIRRVPKREARSTTTSLRIGYDRALTPTLSLGLQGGVYTIDQDDTDLLRDTDATNFPDEQARLDALAQRTRSDTGILANVTLTKDTGVTRYSGKFGVDVLPSDVGSQVESLELVGDMITELSPLLDFSFRVRAYEPDALTPNPEDRFSRRFLSIEPKLIWEINRSWTVAGSYRYRRQKSQVDTGSGESNAILLSLKFTPPSAIRDAEQGGR